MFSDMGVWGLGLCLALFGFAFCLWGVVFVRVVNSVESCVVVHGADGAVVVCDCVIGIKLFWVDCDLVEIV